MITPMRSRPPFGQLGPSPAHDELAAGELWTTGVNKEDWPVVICDEPMTLIFFKDRLRPFSARKADGTWSEDYKSGGIRVSQRSYPTIILGQLRFTWIVREKLHQFETELGEAFTLSTRNPLHAQAWREAIRLYALEDPLPDLKKAIYQQRIKKGHPETSTGSDNIANIKRKGSPLSKNSYSMDETDDEEPKAGFLQQGSNTSHRIKKEPGESDSVIDISANDGSNDLEDLELEQPEKKSRVDTLGRSSRRPSTPSTQVRVGTQTLSSRRMSMSRATPASALQTITDDPNKVIIYVDNPHTAFGVTRSSLAASPLLSKWVIDHPDHGSYIMSPILSQLQKDDFWPVGQYLERAEYDPNILDEGTEWVRLVTEVSGPDAAEEVMRCATIYDIARMLELPGLQDLAFRKLKALAKKVPHQPSAILCAADIVFKIAQPNMRQYLVEYFAKHFWSLMMDASRDLAELMQGNDELRKKVCGLLAGPPEAEVKPEAEEKIKDEDQKDTSRYHANVATATDEDPPEDDKPVIIPAEEQTIMRRTAREILNADDVDECNALDDDAAAYAIAATLPYPLPAELPAEIERQLQEGLGHNYEGVIEVLDDIREEDEHLNRVQDDNERVRKALDEVREEDRQLDREDNARFLEG